MICIPGSYVIVRVEKEDTEILWDINQVSKNMVLIFGAPAPKIWCCILTAMEVEVELDQFSHRCRKPELSDLNIHGLFPHIKVRGCLSRVV